MGAAERDADRRAGDAAVERGRRGGLASGKLEDAKVNGTPATGCASVTNATWTAIGDPRASATLAGATSWADGFAGTPPATPNGYDCIRGSVTDTASQTTVVVNLFGIK